MICHEYKTIFVHIPKTGGQSIETFFLKQFNLNWEERSKLYIGKNPKDKGPDNLSHFKASEYVKYDYVTKEKYDNYFSFAFVRNPWKRVVSLYHYMRFDKLISFDTFIKIQLPRLLKQKHILVIPQYEFVYNEKGDVEVDFIGRLEQINEDFKIVQERLNLPLEKLPHINKRGGNSLKGWRNLKHNLYKVRTNLHLIPHLQMTTTEKMPTADYYNKALKDRVAQMYKKDIELFDYQYPED